MRMESRSTRRTEVARLGHGKTGSRSGIVSCCSARRAAQRRRSEPGALPDQRTARAIAFVDGSLAWFGRRGVTVERVMTDNAYA